MLADLRDQVWPLIANAKFELHCRRSERRWRSFLSRVCASRRLQNLPDINTPSARRSLRLRKFLDGLARKYTEVAFNFVLEEIVLEPEKVAPAGDDTREGEGVPKPLPKGPSFERPRNSSRNLRGRRFEELLKVCALGKTHDDVQMVTHVLKEMNFHREANGPSTQDPLDAQAMARSKETQMSAGDR